MTNQLFDDTHNGPTFVAVVSTKEEFLFLQSVVSVKIFMRSLYKIFECHKIILKIYQKNIFDTSYKHLTI